MILEQYHFEIPLSQSQKDLFQAAEHAVFVNRVDFVDFWKSSPYIHNGDIYLTYLDSPKGELIEIDEKHQYVRVRFDARSIMNWIVWTNRGARKFQRMEFGYDASEPIGPVLGEW